MSKNRTPKLVVGIVASFMGLAGVIIFLLATKIVSVQIGILMLVMSVGMHLGFGILIAVYRLVGKLEWAEAAFRGPLHTAGGARRACWTKGLDALQESESPASFGRH